MIAWLTLELTRGRRRIIGLLLFGALFLAAAVAARLVSGEDGHVEVDQLMEIGGYTMVSALLLTGWLIGRFPLIAALVLMAGVHSDDRVSGLARLVGVRARSPLLVFLLRVTLALVLAFVISILVLPSFDLIMLGKFPGMQLIALVAADVLVYGTLTALLSTFVRADAWAAAFLAIVAMIWQALLRAGILTTSPPGVREVVTVLLPPYGALMRLEQAFAGDLAVPWAALGYAALYGALALLLAGVIAERREV